MKCTGLCIHTDNAPRLAAFYQSLLQEEPFIEGTHYGFSAVAVYDPGGVVVPKDKHIWVQCVTEDADAEYARLLREIPDITVVSPPHRKPWGAYSFWVADPDGNTVAVAQINN